MPKLGLKIALCWSANARLHGYKLDEDKVEQDYKGECAVLCVKDRCNRMDIFCGNKHERGKRVARKKAAVFSCGEKGKIQHNRCDQEQVTV